MKKDDRIARVRYGRCPLKPVSGQNHQTRRRRGGGEERRERNRKSVTVAQRVASKLLTTPMQNLKTTT